MNARMASSAARFMSRSPRDVPPPSIGGARRRPDRRSPTRTFSIDSSKLLIPMEASLDLGLRACWEQARAAWPGVELSYPTFAAWIAERIDGSASLAELRCSDLYLACACAGGDARAH